MATVRNQGYILSPQQNKNNVDINRFGIDVYQKKNELGNGLKVGCGRHCKRLTNITYYR
jgi:hypothetical protein